VKVCSKRKKYKTDITTTRVLMLSEYLDKENSTPNVIEEHVNKWEDDQLVAKEWQAKAPKLKDMFTEVDKFQLDTEEVEQEGEKRKKRGKKTIKKEKKVKT
jgi:hypothetical protein